MYRKILLACACIIVISVVYYNRIYFHLNLTRIAAEAGGVKRKWNVVSEYDNSHEAAARIARVHSTAVEFMRYLKTKYHIDEPDDIIGAEGEKHYSAINSPNDIYNMVDHLLNNYNPDTFYENDPRYSPDTSYTINKGDAMYVCVRNKDNPNTLVDEDTLLFVMLHEMAHIANYKGWGHDIAYWTIFKWLLHEAVLAGIYKPVDYDANPVNFCGLIIYYQPLNDDRLKNLWE